MTRSSGDGASGGNDRGQLGSKIARLVDKYGLDDTAAELEESWTAQGRDRRSLRELADLFNQRLLERHLEEADQRPLAGELEALYSVLTNEEGNESDRIRARRRLEQKGVDVDALLDEFVSYQTVRRYLRNHRDASHKSEDFDRLSRETKNLMKLRGRAQAVTRNKLESLRSTSDLQLGQFRVSIDVRIYCEECETQLKLDRLLDEESCSCER